MSDLVAFLAHASLEAGEGQAEAGADGVQLMTLHSAKGLEFDLVFVTGLEEGLFPSGRSLEESGRSEEHTSELQSLMRISYAVFCLKKKTENKKKSQYRV